MTAPYGWGLVVVAVAATLIALWAGPNLAIALPAAVAAIGAAALLFAEVGIRASTARRRRVTGDVGVKPEEVRAALQSGPLGRERLVLLLEMLERHAEGPNSASKPPVDRDEIAKMSPQEFRAYLGSHLDDLEART